MSVRRRICALERKCELKENLDAPVTFIEMAHGIRDELFRKGKSPRRLQEAKKNFEVAWATLTKSWQEDVNKDQ